MNDLREALAHAEAFRRSPKGRALAAVGCLRTAFKSLLAGLLAALTAFLMLLISRAGLAALAAALLALVAVGLWRFDRLAAVQQAAPGPKAERAYK